jgi:hypothetical protein
MDDKGFLAMLSRYSSLTELVEQLYVPAILESYKRLVQEPEIPSLSENKIRNKFARDLEYCNGILKELLDQNILYLVYEATKVYEMNDETSRTDIEFLMPVFGRFIVECKKQDSYSSDYIIEGVYRFRDGKYQSKEACMLAFIVGGKLAKIVSKTKTIIEADSSFVPSEILEAVCATHPHSFHSMHYRVSTSPILIHHIFLDFTSS